MDITNSLMKKEKKTATKPRSLSSIRALWMFSPSSIITVNSTKKWSAGRICCMLRSYNYNHSCVLSLSVDLSWQETSNCPKIYGWCEMQTDVCEAIGWGHQTHLICDLGPHLLVVLKKKKEKKNGGGREMERTPVKLFANLPRKLF